MAWSEIWCDTLDATSEVAEMTDDEIWGDTAEFELPPLPNGHTCDEEPELTCPACEWVEEP